MALSNRALAAAQASQDHFKDRDRFAEIARIEAFQRAQQSAPPPAPAAPPRANPLDTELAAINARMASEQADSLKSRAATMAQPVLFGPPQVREGAQPESPAGMAGPAAFGSQRSAEDEINARQQMMAAQFTSPTDPGPGAMPYQRLERTGVAVPPGHPKYDTDKHLRVLKPEDLRPLKRGEQASWRVPVPLTKVHD
jgi:hypothetical protein